MSSHAYPPIPLTEMKPGYDGRSLRLELYPQLPWLDEAKTIEHYENPGVVLQKVEGCGYDVTEMTADQADHLANQLLKAAAETRAAFGVRAVVSPTHTAVLKAIGRLENAAPLLVADEPAQLIADIIRELREAIDLSFPPS